MSKSWIRALGSLFLAACASTGGSLFHRGTLPASLAGSWADSTKSTPADTSVWLLTPAGEDRNVRLRIVGGPNGQHIDSSSSRYGSWYLSGTLADTSGRALCILRRARDGGSCMHFRLDTIERAGQRRRRLEILGYVGARSVGKRVLIERRP